jgi:hypothetical protein
MKRVIAITTVAAAMLLGGTAHADWYLMVPPIGVNVARTQRAVIFKAALPYWKQARSGFAIEQDCLQATTNFAGQHLLELSLSGKPVDAGLVLGQGNNARCVSSDDPRLVQDGVVRKNPDGSISLVNPDGSTTPIK